MVPCLGVLNWFGVPTNAAGLTVGIVGLAKSETRGRGAFVAAIIVCAVGMVGGAIRCIGGGGIV